MSSKNPQHNGAAVLEHGRGTIVCRSVERRALYETLGIENRVTFEGPAAEKGRQAEEGDHEQEESADELPPGDLDDEVREFVESREGADVDE